MATFAGLLRVAPDVPLVDERESVGATVQAVSKSRAIKVLSFCMSELMAAPDGFSASLIMIQRS